jgi:hypothetical protein
LFESADQLFGSASIAENPSSNMANHSSECPQNTVLDTATPMRGTSDESGPSSPMDLSGIRSYVDGWPTCTSVSLRPESQTRDQLVPGNRRRCVERVWKKCEPSGLNSCNSVRHARRRKLIPLR